MVGLHIEGRDRRRSLAALIVTAVIAAILVSATSPVAAAADPLRGLQWGLDNVHIDDAYPIAGDGSGVVIAIVDSGVDLDHPDLEDKLVAGWDFVDSDAVPDDGNGHGTHVAGIAAAVTANGMGIAGAAPGAKIMPVRVLDDTGVGSTDNVAAGIDWAVANGADIVNLSLGGGTDLLSRIFKSGPMNDAIINAEDNGVLVVVAAGNDDTFIIAYKSGTPVLVVNASNPSDDPASFTSFGDPRAVAAPGTLITSTAPLTPTTIWPGGSASGYEPLSGTSMSTPLVAGIAALMVEPGRTPADIRQAIRETAENPGDQFRLGAGVVNAATAVAWTAYEGTFSDDDGNTHEPNIELIAAIGVTKGCNPPENTLYCPADSVTRGEMAAFLTRALGLPAASVDYFTDDDGTTFEGDINRVAEAGITKGCNPPANDLYCPDRAVTREEMAAFLVRAFGYTDNGDGDLFVDDDGSMFEADIDKLGTAGITKGCNPPTNDEYCPKKEVRRDEMASFLARALELP